MPRPLRARTHWSLAHSLAGPVLSAHGLPGILGDHRPPHDRRPRPLPPSGLRHRVLAGGPQEEPSGGGSTPSVVTRWEPGPGRQRKAHCPVGVPCDLPPPTCTRELGLRALLQDTHPSPKHAPDTCALLPPQPRPLRKGIAARDRAVFTEEPQFHGSRSGRAPLWRRALGQQLLWGVCLVFFQVLAQSAPSLWAACVRGQEHLSVTALPPATQLPAGRGLQMH